MCPSMDVGCGAAGFRAAHRGAERPTNRTPRCSPGWDEPRDRHRDLSAAADGRRRAYTDVWVSMGKEEEAAYRSRSSPTIRSTVARGQGQPGALVCTACRVSRKGNHRRSARKRTPDTIFTQAENRPCTRRKRLLRPGGREDLGGRILI